jgi:hypothetical protein
MDKVNHVRCSVYAADEYDLSSEISATTLSSRQVAANNVHCAGK